MAALVRDCRPDSVGPATRRVCASWVSFGGDGESDSAYVKTFAGAARGHSGSRTDVVGAVQEAALGRALAMSTKLIASLTALWRKRW